MDSLLKNATRVLSLQTLRPLGWLSDSVLLATETRPIKKPNGKYVYRSVAIDLQNGKRQTQAENPNRPKGGVLSPNGNWILTRYGAPGIEELSAFSLKNSSSQRWHLVNSLPGKGFYDASEPIWIAEGRAWVMLVFRCEKNNQPQLYALHGKLDHPGKIQPLPLGESNDATGGYFTYWNEIGLAHLVTSPDGDLIVGMHSVGAKDRTQLWRWEFRLSQGQRSRREFKVPFAEDEGVKAVSYHARNQRLAALTTQTYDQWSIYTMRLDGSQRICLGTITSRYPLQNLQWLPSGKKLSFEHDHALWVLPDAPPASPKLL